MKLPIPIVSVHNPSMIGDDDDNVPVLYYSEDDNGIYVFFYFPTDRDHKHDFSGWFIGEDYVLARSHFNIECYSRTENCELYITSGKHSAKCVENNKAVLGRDISSTATLIEIPYISYLDRSFKIMKKESGGVVSSPEVWDDAQVRAWAKWHHSKFRKMIKFHDNVYKTRDLFFNAPGLLRKIIRDELERIRE